MTITVRDIERLKFLIENTIPSIHQINSFNMSYDTYISLNQAEALCDIVKQNIVKCLGELEVTPEE